MICKKHDRIYTDNILSSFFKYKNSESRNKQLFSDSSIIIALVLKGDNFYFAL